VTRTADAWLLRKRAPDAPLLATLERATIDIGAMAPDEAVVAPLYGCWEANMSHARQRLPVDICAKRGEDAVVIGNAACVRVLEVGDAVTEVVPGELAMLHSAGRTDRHGYMTHALGYDAPGQMGCVATRMRLKGRQLVALSPDSRLSPMQWAAFAVRYVTAWANWRVALPVARAFRDADVQPALHVWGWGGGTTLAELDLARRQGHDCAMVSGRDANLDAIAQLGIAAVDRREFGTLYHDPEANGHDLRANRMAERAFLAAVRERTDGEGVHVFVDYIGEPVWRATRRVLAREGVVTTAGWKQGMKLDFLRASECIGHRQFIHTHYARRQDAVDAVAFAEADGWAPGPPPRVYGFDEIPELIEDYEAGRAGYFPCFAIAAP
jgi:NADPH:quinone reductase-like Zn-dependent oxidoreductase